MELPLPNTGALARPGGAWQGGGTGAWGAGQGKGQRVRRREGAAGRAGRSPATSIAFWVDFFQ